MLPLSEIAALKATVDDEWCSPVADSVGIRWGLAVGSLRWWRSSNSHVFVVPDGVDPRGAMFARFARRDSVAGDRLRRGAEVQARLSPSGAVAAPVIAAPGRVIETVDTPLGEMVAVMVAAVDGEELDVDDLDASRASEWGRALAAFHAASPPPPAAADVFDVFNTLTDEDDERLLAAAQILAARATTFASARHVLGHGDFELDNVRWTSDGVVCFDLDEASPMPVEVDIASATRDLYDPAGNEPLHPGLLRRFLDGYADLSGVEVAPEDLVLGRAALAAASLRALPQVLDLSDADEHGLADLERRLIEHRVRSRRMLRDAADRLT